MYSSTGNTARNIGNSGCGPTCAAMVIDTLKHNGITPIATCAWSSAHGYRKDGQGTYWAYFVPQLSVFGIKAHQTTSHAEVKKALEGGHMVIGRAKEGLWTSSGHFILAWKIDGDTIYINDPNSTKTSRSVAPYKTWCNEVKPMWIIDDLANGDDMRYNNFTEIQKDAPYAVPAIKHLCDKGYIKGSGKKDAQGYPADMDLSMDMIRMFVINYRAGLYN
jgi:hypothetical protein